MAKVDYIDPVYALHGRLGTEGKAGKVVFKQLASTGTSFTSKHVEKVDRVYSAEEIARQQKFAVARAAMEVALADPEQLAALKAAFQKQKKYKTLRGFVFAQKYAMN
ncbi:MAG: hypothetical protein IJS73_01640 [Paludibacteraceae bacterium]|nr:hypothetical protein [Paludibacteraceae bacterium]